MQILANALSVLLLATFSLSLKAADYNANRKEVNDFAARMEQRHDFKREDILSILEKAEKKQSILDAIARPAEKTLTWEAYRKIFLGDKRIKQGVDFWDKHAELITSVSEHFDVEPAIIVAIVGVETRYGLHMGKYRVLDALATLGFDYPKRSKFFLKQLEEFLLLTREQNLPITALLGSYAGAMGYGQFIPSSYRAYAVDYDGDNVADIWSNPADALGSVANYFKAHGWRTGDPVVAKLNSKTVFNKRKPNISLGELEKSGLTLVKSDKNVANNNTKVTALMLQGENGIEYWAGFHNFYVITRYNHSHMYAMAVHQLSEAIAIARNSRQIQK